MAHWNDDGGHAHPRTGYLPDLSTGTGDDWHAALSTVTFPVDGMTLRDYFAAQFMAGMAASGSVLLPFQENYAEGPERAAKQSYRFAQAMIAEKRRIEAAEQAAWQAEIKRRLETGEQDD